jgi:hypothetical protein
MTFGPITVTPLFAWQECWVGACWNPYDRSLYIFPLPMCGMLVRFGLSPADRMRRMWRLFFGPAAIYGNPEPKPESSEP